MSARKAEPVRDRRRRWGCAGCLLVGLVVVVAVPYGVYRVLTERVGEKVQAELKRLEERGVPTTPQALRAFCMERARADGAVVVPAVSDFADVCPALGSTLEEIENQEPAFGRVAYIQAHRAEYEELIRRYTPALERARTIYHIPHVYFDTRYEDDFGALLPYLQGMRSMARMHARRAIDHACRQEAEAALADVAAILDLQQALAHQPLLVDQLVCVALQAIAVNAASDVCEVLRSDPAGLRSLAARFAAVAQGEPVMARGMVGERVIACQFMEKVRRGVYGPEQMWQMRTGDGDPLIWILAHSDLFVLTNFHKLLQVYDACERAAYLSPADAEVFRNTQENVAPVLSEAEVSRFHVLARLLASSLWRTLENQARAVAGLRLAALGLRLHADRVEGKPYPETLADRLAADAEDPFASAPFRMRTVGNALILYSVGPDTKDSGGFAPASGTPGTPGYVGPARAGDDVFFLLPLLP